MIPYGIITYSSQYVVNCVTQLDELRFTFVSMGVIHRTTNLRAVNNSSGNKRQYITLIHNTLIWL